MVETTKCGLGPAKPKNILNAPYDPKRTMEHKVDIPYLHPIDVPQFIHETQVIAVPQTVVQEKIVKVPTQVIKERIVKERPTEIHYIELKKNSAPIMFAETVEPTGWPWWWWLPLLLLCCCLPLC